MTRERPLAVRRRRALLGAALLLSVAPTARAAAPQLPYRVLPLDERVTRRGEIVGELLVIAGGTDASDEERLAAAVARTRASQQYRPRPAIWKIGDRDTTIYLFGTMHSLPPGFAWRSPTLDAIVARAGTLVLESTAKDDRAGDLMMGATTPGAAKPPPLIERVSPERRDLLAQFEASLPGGAVALLDEMPTWVAAMSISFVRDLRAGDQPGPGADDWLETHFRAAGKRVEAIEDSSKVVAHVNAIPEPAQRAMLDTALTAPDRTVAELTAPAHAWAKGEIGPDSPVAMERSGQGNGALAGQLLDTRNQAWTGRLVRRLREPGTILFAAGAGHFIGPGSVIDLLRKRGMRVTRVE